MPTTPDPFTAAQAFVLTTEGGFVNNPKDPGGMTNLGVTKSAWEGWLGHSVTEADMRALTPATVQPFYKATFWRPINGDKLPPAIALLVYQAAVNMGVKRAATFLQIDIGADTDGDIGPATLVSVRNKVAAVGIPTLLKSYCDALRGYYKTRSDFTTFGKGWLTRVDNAYAAALKLV